MKRFFTLLFLLLLSALPASLGETAVSVSPEAPRAGDYVEVIVTPGREDPESVSYSLFYGEELQKIFAGKGVQQYDVWLRPRQEGTYTLRVTVSWGRKDTETVEILLPVSGTAPVQEGRDVIYSQKDGWWKKKKYSTTELQTAGCAIFTMSHLLQRMGFTGEQVLPEKLARTYVYYREGEGTWNEGLVRYAAVDYDFTTQRELLTSVKEIAASLRQGDAFSFSIVDRHIALADGISEDGTKVHIVDSAPGATYERIRFPGKIFVRNNDGSFSEAPVPEDHPGCRWFFETQEYGGLEYWMDIEYCASRGMRLIRQPWLRADLGDGLKSVEVEYAGALVTKVSQGGQPAVRIPTRDLRLTRRESSVPQVALVTAKKGLSLLDGNGKVLSGKKKIPRQTMVLVLEASEDSLYVWWDDAYGYIPAEDVTLLSPDPEAEIRTAMIAMNGYTNGVQQVTVHLNPDAKSTGLALWKTGTPVALVEQQDHYWLVEGKGLRGWVHEKYILPDSPEETAGQPAE